LPGCGGITEDIVSGVLVDGDQKAHEFGFWVRGNWLLPALTRWAASATPTVPEALMDALRSGERSQ
jgi:hypothetical protein